MGPSAQRTDHGNHSNCMLLSENLPRTVWLCLPGTPTLLPIYTLIPQIFPSNIIQLSILLWWIKYSHKFFATIMRWNLFTYSFDLGWLCHLLSTNEYDKSDAIPLLKLRPQENLPPSLSWNTGLRPPHKEASLSYWRMRRMVKNWGPQPTARHVNEAILNFAFQQLHEWAQLRPAEKWPSQPTESREIIIVVSCWVFRWFIRCCSR